jgi:PRC-barrel domain
MTVVAESLADWLGKDVLDADGEKVGKLDGVFYDAEVDVPSFVAVKSGLVGKHLTLVPLQDASVSPDFLRLGYRKAMIKDAPNYDTDTEMTVEGEADAYKYFGLEYTTAGDGARRLAKR